MEAGCVCTHRLMSLSLAALTSCGFLADYLDLLKEMKAQMNTVQSFLDAHVGLLEELNNVQPVQDSGKCDNTDLVFLFFFKSIFYLICRSEKKENARDSSY